MIIESTSQTGKFFLVVLTLLLYTIPTKSKSERGGVKTKEAYKSEDTVLILIHQNQMYFLNSCAAGCVKVVFHLLIPYCN